jgi:amino acid adenylation domain-containing protein
LSFAQERIWFLDQLNPGDPLFNLSRAVRISGRLNFEALQQALTSVVMRNEILRTTFAKSEHHANTDGRPLQLISSVPNVTINLLAADCDQQANEIARAEARMPFDLTLGPLFRAVLIRLDEAEHILLLSTHRIVADELSLQLILRELVRQAASLSSLPPHQSEGQEDGLQFGDYSEWERNRLQDDTARDGIDWWRQKLSDAPALLEIPTNRPRPALQTSNGDSCRLELSSQTTALIRELSIHANSTVENIVLTALKILLARYSRQTDILVGLATINRPENGRHLIGPFADTVVIRTDLAQKESFDLLLARVTKGVKNAREHDSIPFAYLVDELRIERSLSHSPLFQVLLRSDTGILPVNMSETLLPVNMGETLLPVNMSETPMPLQIEPFEFEAGIAAYDLTLTLEEACDCLKLRLEYNTDLFDRATAERILGHLEAILSKAVRDPKSTFDASDLLTEEEANILRDWNSTSVSYDTDSVVDLFEKQVARSASSEAVVFEGQALTYLQLNSRANQLAHYLRKRGIGPDSCVGVCFDRSVDMVVSVLATLKAGGAYVPLDPKYPAERLRFMLSNSNCSVVLTSEAAAKHLPGTTAAVVRVDGLTDVLRSESSENLLAAVHGDNLAYVIYTSGSTGWPKGVAMTHRALANVINWQLEPPFVASRTLQFASLSFDVSFQELFSTWCSGSTLVLISDEVRANATAMLRLLVSQKVERLFLPFVYLQHLAEAAGTNAITPSNLREVITAGEQLEITPQIAKFFSQLPDCKLHNHYGPSETHVVTTYSSRDPVADWATLPPIGQPISNTQIYIVNADLTLAPVGIPGELLIGGTSLSRGYLDRPEATAEKYVPNPFGSERGARLYRTGDLARYRDDGNIDFLGRIDNQVKIRGFRIELGEIEAALRTHSAIRDVVVLPREKNDGLVAYIVSDREPLNGAESLASTLRAHLGARLPDYMVPAIYVELQRLPLTPSGKVDRRALSVPADYRPESSQRIAPRDEIETGLAQLWERVLSLKEIGVTDNFFELGGHSLMASRLFAQIENRFGRNLPLATLFQSPTIEQLAAVLRAHETRDTWSSLVPIQPLGSRPPLFCVHAAGANVLIYRPLARHLGLDQPVYALQAQGLDGYTAPYDNVEEIATHYLKDVRALQPEGPYFLLGASFGGLVIYEMALQLQAQGQEVALLAMLNTDCPVVSLGKRVKCHVENLRQKGLKVYSLAALGSVLGRVNAKAGAALEAASANRELKEAIASRPDLNDPLVQTVLANLEAEKNYRPSVRDYPGRITYFWAKDAGSGYDDNRLAWKRLARGGFDLYQVPGDHATMREEPHVATLVEKLRPILDRTRRI